ncbi:ankyrin repeat-containing domain protein [Coprinopsis sp. MPI-PUGE-AT-0042]|nr:ankyrin repeat-containing domain protein [Coprinopsis sp. MPI-PUGE-AT-0042]
METEEDGKVPTTFDRGTFSKPFHTPMQQPKRKRDKPQTKNDPPQAKRGCWRQDDEQTLVDGSSRDFSTAVIAGAQSAQITGGVFTIAGRDHITIHNHHYGPLAIDVLAILKSSRLPNLRAIQQDTLAKAVEGTCVWLTEGEVLRIWLERGKVLWGKGIPGAGKTVLAAIVIRHLQRLEALTGAISVAFVYIRYSEPLSIRDILESLVAQTLERHADLIPYAEPLYLQHQREGTRPSQSELVDLLWAFIHSGKTMFFILDALDELSSEDRRTLVELLASMDVKLFVTSRPLQALERHFPEAQFFDIAARPADIALLIKDSVRRNSELQELLSLPGLEEHTAHAIQQAAGGMFLHAQLQLEALRHCSSALDVQMALQAFPSDLSTFYHRTWSRIAHKDLAIRVLLWIIYAKRELTIEELRRCVAISLETYAYDASRTVSGTFILAICCGLVTVDDKINRVRLIHFTAKEALQPLVLQAFPLPHAILASACVTHLKLWGFQTASFKSGAELRETLDKDPFLSYAHSSWHAHARLDRITNAVVEFVLGCSSFGEIFGGRADLLGPLHLAAFHGLYELLHHCARVQSVNASTPDRRRAPLHLACLSGHKACVEALLSLPEAQVDMQDSAGYTPLMMAISGGDLDTIQVLLRDQEVAINKVSDDGATALIHACILLDVEAVRAILCVPGVDVNVADRRGRTALAHASRRAKREISKALLKVPGIDATLEMDEGYTALIWASRIGDVEMLQLILDAPGIDVNEEDVGQRCALMIASRFGHVDSVKTLLKAPGININAIDEHGETALMTASEQGHVAVVQALLEAPSVDIGLSSTAGDTALSLASAAGHGAVASLIRSQLPRRPT